MKSNFTNRYIKRKYAYEWVFTKKYSPFYTKNGLKSLNARKTLHKISKSLQRKAKNIIAPNIINNI